MAHLPTGTITFLFTDIEGSTLLWEHHPDAMRTALIRHDALVEETITAHAGVVVRPRGEGDSRFAVFSLASDAVAAACALQQALHTEPWPSETFLRGVSRSIPARRTYGRGTTMARLSIAVPDYAP